MKTYGTFVLFSILLVVVGCVPSMAPTELAFNDSKVADPTGGAGNVANRAQSLEAFKQTVYPVVRGRTCLNCHDSATKSQSPVFADNDPEKAFDAITLSRKVDFTKSSASRIVMKLLNEAHNCWSGNCVADSKEVQDAVDRWIAMAPVDGGAGGIATDTLPLPQENTAQVAQTEYGSLLLQAEQELYRSEVIEGRYSDQQDSNALEGKFLHLTPIESNPITQANRTLPIIDTYFNNCREFIAADLEPATRAVRMFQERVHIPSGETNPQGKVVNDGYRPFTAAFSFQIVRPDKRLEYAKMIASGNYLSALNVMLTNGAPNAVTTKVAGTKLPDGFQGTALTNSTTARALPYFVPWSTVFNPDKSFKNSGSYVNDDGATQDLYTLFKEGAYSPNADVLQKKLMQNSSIKRDIFYKRYKEIVADFFYSSPTTRRSPYKLPYSGFVNADVVTYFSPDVSVQLVCPAGDCVANPNLLKYQVSQSGAPLTQANALDCYTLNAGDTAIVPAAPANCSGTNPRYFHYIDLFIRPMVSDASLKGAQTVSFYNSDSPSTFVDNETFTEDAAKRLVFNNEQTVQELDPDVFFAGGASLVSDADNVRNFSTTLHATLKTVRCIDCHGNPAMANAPQFVNSNVGTALAVLTAGRYIDFNNPRASFREPNMIHNCNGASADPRYSCDSVAEENLRVKLADAITAWKTANAAAAASAGTKSYRSLSRDERLPGRTKYKFKVTQAGLYNVWMKLKNTQAGVKLNFRILNSAGNPVNYSSGAAAPGGNSCYSFSPTTSPDGWEWTTPGRAAELSKIDQRGYILLDNNKQPLALPNNRIYFNLAEGNYTLDVIGLTSGVKLDAVGVNRVENFQPDSLLDFQPDRRAVDEKNISDYKRKILRYELTDKLNLTGGKKAFYEIEVKKAFSGQNYVFRNPRFITSPRDFNLRVKGIKVYINGKWNYPDSTYNEIDVITGDNKVLTYAPLVALTVGANDLIHFQFEKLEITTEALTPIYPKGSLGSPITDRRCADLDYFVKNVKPILFNVKVMLNSEISDMIGGFPGGPRSDATGQPRAYNCITCHTQNHPYFKMSTFTNDEEFCREALSRVDFQNFYQSLVIRGINGTGNHPKFVFMEKFVSDAQDNFRMHDNGQDYINGFYKNNVGIASQIIPGPMMLWTKADMGIAGSTYSALSAQDKLKIAKNGLLRSNSNRRIDLAVLGFSWYVADTHYPLIYDPQDGGLDNVLSAYDVIDPDPAKGKIYGDRRRGPKIIDINTFDGSGIPMASDLGGNGDNIMLKAGTKTYVTNGQPGFDKAQIDYISTTPGMETEAQMWTLYEQQRDYYREKVINWIRRENAARLLEEQEP